MSCVCVCVAGIGVTWLTLNLGWVILNAAIFVLRLLRMFLLSPLGPFEPSDSGQPSYTSKQWAAVAAPLETSACCFLD